MSATTVLPGASLRRRRLTKAVVEAAEPGAVEYTIWDSAIPGFGLRVRPTGAKSYVFVYRTAGGRAGKTKRVTVKAASVDGARDQAKALSGKHHSGDDPAAEKAEARREAEREKLTPTVGDVLDRWLKEYVDEHLKPKTGREYHRLVNKVLTPKLGAIRIDALAPKDVAEAHHAMRTKPTQAALAVRVLSSAMSWAEERGFRPAGSNPARIRLKGTRRRERLFSDAEVARLLRAIDRLQDEKQLTESVALGLRLLFETGCRAGEICGLRWSGVDLDEGTLRWDDSKTGVLEKPITPEVERLLRSARRIVGVDWACPSPTLNQLRVETLEAGFERTMQAAGVEAKENASLHLIRHWFATKTYSDASIPLPRQMAILGHRSVATAMRYAHVRRDEVRRDAARAARSRTNAIRTAGKKGTVVTLPGRG